MRDAPRFQYKYIKKVLKVQAGIGNVYNDTFFLWHHKSLNDMLVSHADDFAFRNEVIAGLRRDFWSIHMMREYFSM